ncbi:hypothetical protein [Sphingomonas sp. UYAg733]
MAAAVAGTLFAALLFAEQSVVGLHLGATKFVLPMVVFSGLFASLNALAGNRRVLVANDARKAEMLAFPPTPGHGWIAVMRDRKNGAPSIGFDMFVDAKVIAQLLPKRFTITALPEGTHHLFADIPGAPGPSAVAPLEVDVVEGCVMIFAIRTSIGVFRTSPRLEPVANTPEARAVLARMLLVEAEAAWS